MHYNILLTGIEENTKFPKNSKIIGEKVYLPDNRTLSLARIAAAEWFKKAHIISIIKNSHTRSGEIVEWYKDGQRIY